MDQPDDLPARATLALGDDIHDTIDALVPWTHRTER